jgi:hypothetical protein
MDWKLGEDLREPLGTYEGVGQSSVPIFATTSARYCFDLVFPAVLRSLILKETNRYGAFFADWRVRAGKLYVPWVHLDDSKLCVFLGLVLVQNRCILFFKFILCTQSYMYIHIPTLLLGHDHC